jgi:hypothetical protein
MKAGDERARRCNELIAVAGDARRKQDDNTERKKKLDTN